MASFSDQAIVVRCQHSVGKRWQCGVVGQVVVLWWISTKAKSGITGANTRTQRERGIEDSAVLFTSDTLKGGAKKPGLAKVLTAVVNLDLSLAARLGGHPAPRTHRSITLDSWQSE